LRVLVLGINGVGERSDGVKNGLWKGARAFGRRILRDFGGRQGIGELAEAEIDFFESFGAGSEEALESDAEIGFEDVALPPPSFVGIDVIGGGDGVAALVLG